MMNSKQEVSVVKNLGSDVGLNLSRKFCIPVGGLDKPAVLTCYELYADGYPVPPTNHVKRYTFRAVDSCTHLGLFEFQSGRFVRSSVNIPTTISTHSCSSVTPQKIFIVNQPGQPGQILLVLESASHIFFIQGIDDSLLDKGLDIPTPESQKRFYIAPLSPTNDIFAVSDIHGSDPFSFFYGSRKIIVHDGKPCESEDTLRIFNKVGQLVTVSASCVLSNGELLIGGVRGEICQISLDSEGKVSESRCIGYLQDGVGKPTIVNYITALPGSNNYIIGSERGALCLVQSRNDKMKIVDQVAWPIGLSLYHDHREPFHVLSVKPLSSNLAIIFTSYPLKFNSCPHERKDDLLSANSSGQQWLCCAKISNNKISLRQADWFCYDDDDDPHLSAISASLQLPDGKLLVGNKGGDLFLVWGSKGVLRYQRIILSEYTTEDVQGTITLRCEASREYNSDTWTSSGAGPARSLSCTEDKIFQATDEAKARYHYYIGGLFLVNEENNYYQVLIQRHYRLGQNDFEQDRIVFEKLKFQASVWCGGDSCGEEYIRSSDLEKDGEVVDNYILSIKKTD